MTTLLHTHGPTVGFARLDAALGVPRATASRWRQQPVHTVRQRRARSPRSLTAETVTAALAVLHEDRFADAAPAQVHATLPCSRTDRRPWIARISSPLNASPTVRPAFPPSPTPCGSTAPKTTRQSFEVLSKLLVRPSHFH